MALLKDYSLTSTKKQPTAAPKKYVAANPANQDFSVFHPQMTQGGGTNGATTAAAYKEYLTQQVFGNNPNYSVRTGVADVRAGLPGSGSAPRPSAPAAPRKVSTAANTSRARTSGGGGGGGGGGGRSGGGGGGAGLQAQYDTTKSSALKQAAILLDLMHSVKAQYAPNDALRGQVNTAVDSDLNASNAANDTLVQRLAGINAVNPYASLQAKSTHLDPSLAGLLQANGADTSGYLAQLQQLNGQGDQMASNWQNAFGAQGANYGADVQSQNAQAAMARAQNGQELGAQRSALLAQVGIQDAAKKAAAQQQLMQLVLQMQQMLGTANATLPAAQQLANPSAAEMGLDF